jgi:hypothetical protein
MTAQYGWQGGKGDGGISGLITLMRNKVTSAATISGLIFRSPSLRPEADKLSEFRRATDRREQPIAKSYLAMIGLCTTRLLPNAV